MNYRGVTYIFMTIALLIPSSIKAYTCDVIVYGGGLGGSAAAIQAKRAAPSRVVCLFEPTDMLGGQATAAGVSTVDDDGQGYYGIWGEFISATNAVYQSYPFFWSPFPQPTFEPRVGAARLYNMAFNAGVQVYFGKTLAPLLPPPATPPVSVTTNPAPSTNLISSITFADGTQASGSYFVDASEYGDLILMLGKLGVASYRIGNQLINRGSSPTNPSLIKVQDITWTAVVKKYPNSLPPALDPLQYLAPPQYLAANFTGAVYFTDACIPYFDGCGPYPFNWNHELSYRYTPDTDPQVNPSSPPFYGNQIDGSQTRGNVNLQDVNDWLMSGAELYDPATRHTTECAAKLRTLQFLYYMRSYLSLPWAVADDEQYNPFGDPCTNLTTYNPIFSKMPEIPYVRESVRGYGAYTLNGVDIYRPCPGCNAQNPFYDVVSTGGYVADFHDTTIHTSSVNPSDLDPIDAAYFDPSYNNIKQCVNDHCPVFPVNASGKFQIPYRVFYSQEVPNLIFAGKNISQTRIGNAATRLHPTEMRNGQVAGMIAGLALTSGQYPKDMAYSNVQAQLSGVTFFNTVASQSSNYPGSPSAGTAFDGNTDGNYYDGTVTATNTEANPWWQVDLGSSRPIGYIAINNRTDCCASRLGDYWVFVSNSPFQPSDTLTTLMNNFNIFKSHQTTAPAPRIYIPVNNYLGRYVRVQLSSTDILSLAEVQVFSGNVVAGKSATQSSIYPDPTFTAGAWLATYGGTNGNYYSHTLSTTNAEMSPWWEVDLSAPTTIGSVTIWNRTDCCGSRLGDYWIFASNTPFRDSDTISMLQSRPNTFASHQTSAPSPSATIPVGFQGQYVRIQITPGSTSTYLSLAGVTVQ
jgi:hypothetical protein